MARERKPLIEPGIIPSEGDVFSRILANDRARHRQGETDAAQTAEFAPPGDGEDGYKVTSNVTALQRTDVTALQEGTTPTRRRRAQPSEAPELPAPVIPAPVIPAPVEPALRAERLGKALSLAAADEIAIVTVRAPAKLNEYMDRYVDRLNRVSPMRRYRKQDAVAEAFAAFFADHPLPPAPAEEKEL